MESTVPIHTLVLDSGPILKNEPTASTLLKQTEAMITTPSVIAEIRDPQARSRLETTLLPFLAIRAPRPDSLRFVSEFSRKTGDYEVLSRTDLEVLGLAYELECERNGGDWRLRRVPGQKRVNGASPRSAQANQEVQGSDDFTTPQLSAIALALNDCSLDGKHVNEEDCKVPGGVEKSQEAYGPSIELSEAPLDRLGACLESTHLFKPASVGIDADSHGAAESLAEEAEAPTESDDDAESNGWITPSNIKKRQAQEAKSTTKSSKAQAVMQIATMTTDFALQNVLMQMNLNLISSTIQRIRHLKTYILRCHACFEKTRDMTKQFCPRCGKPTMMRAACSTNDQGEFRIHLKRNMQWNTRGDRFSIPKPVNGSANGRVNMAGGGKGGGTGGWGQALLLTEDQKEYQRTLRNSDRARTHDPMDADYLPSILTGERGRTGARPKIGAGRDVNARRRRK